MPHAVEHLEVGERVLFQDREIRELACLHGSQIVHTPQRLGTTQRSGADHLQRMESRLPQEFQFLDRAEAVDLVDEQIFLKSENTESDHKRFIHISTGVDAIKNLSGMIRAFDTVSQKRQDLTLDIVSDGDVEYAKLLASKIHYPSLIRFHSTKTTKEIAKMLQHSDALLVFSNYENFPCVIPEAFMTGKPVISTAVNGIPEHVNPQNGILVERGNENQLSDAIEKMLNDEVSFNPEQIRHYAMEHFSYTTVGKKLDKVYRKVLAQTKFAHAE